MKKSSSKLPTFVLALSLAIIPPVLSSCKSVESINSNLSTLDLRHSTHTDTVVLRDSIYIRDSIIINERTIHDTVYITKEVYRDRLEARGERQKAVRTDTVVVTEWREKVIELPPERYVPKFYKWCTGLLWAILVLAIGRFALKHWLGVNTK